MEPHSPKRHWNKYVVPNIKLRRESIKSKFDKICKESFINAPELNSETKI